MRVLNFSLVLFFLAAMSVQADCITVNRNKVGTQWSIVDKALERWVYRNYHRQVDFTCSDWGSDKALCMPDWMRNTPGMGGANPMTFCSVNVGTHRQVYLTNQDTVDRWLRAERRKRYRPSRRSKCPYKGEMLRKVHCW